MGFALQTCFFHNATGFCTVSKCLYNRVGKGVTLGNFRQYFPRGKYVSYDLENCYPSENNAGPK
jgi:hypothetical protein